MSRTRRAMIVESLESRRLFAGVLSEQIIVDQFGWRADALRKVVLFADPINGQNSAVSYTPGATFQVRRVSDEFVAFTGSTVSWKNGATDAMSGDKVWSGDFSSLTTPGEYYVYDPTRNLRSYAFRIDNGVYNDVLKTSVRTFYYQRAGVAIDAAHGGNWTHAAGHVGPNQDHAARLWNNGGATNPSTARDLWGGWYDAGDYNKYVPYTTSPMWNLLSSYEWNPAAFGDNWNIPESGNGVADVLDEIKFETDWLLRMQMPNGSVLNRVANASYSSGNSDPSTDTQARYYTQATTWATASFAATIAHAARVFAPLGGAFATYAQTLTTAAQNAWNYLVATPNMTPASGKDGGGTGGGTSLAATEADSTVDGEKRLRVLAAAELYKTTGGSTYKNYFEQNYRNPNTTHVNPWGTFHPLLDGTPRFDSSQAQDLNRAYMTYATTTGANTSIVNEIKAALLNNLDESWLQIGDYNNGTDPYRAFMWEGHYSWGSNQTKSEWANILTYALRLNVGTAAQQAKAREVAEEYLHYFHGRNPLSQTYLSNMGTKGANLGGDKSVMQVYHSWFGDGSALYDGANSTYGPVPGFLVGGANVYFSVGSITPPAGQPAMKAFKDWNTGYPEASWEITEPAIYYQAAYTLLLSQFATAPVVAFPAWLSTGSNATWNAGTNTLTVNGPATITANPAAYTESDHPIVNVATGATLTINPTAGGRVDLGTLNLANGATAVVTAGPATRVVVIETDLNLTGTAKLNLTNNAMVIHGVSLNEARSWITAGYNNGAWTGNGINSSTAASDLTYESAIAYADGASYGLTTFEGVTVGGSDILVRTTKFGDADLSGTVDLDDFNLFLAGYQNPSSSPQTWLYGDFDYSGVIDLDDFNLFLAAYQ